MIYLSIGLGVVASLGFLMLVLLKTPPARLSKILRLFASAMLVLLAVYLVLRGQINLVAILLVPLIALWRQYLTRKFTAPAGPTPGQQSSVETLWLSMSLDHITGHTDGVVKQGSLVGRRLSSLSLPDLISLVMECRANDPPSVVLLEAFLDRVYPDWRVDTKASSASSTLPMSRDEAFAILGLSNGATEDEIKTAHRRLMKKLHPDQGGSNYLAGQINRAKDVLLN